MKGDSFKIWRSDQGMLEEEAHTRFGCFFFCIPILSGHVWQKGVNRSTGEVLYLHFEILARDGSEAEVCLLHMK
jgi:hypothetical protein